MKDSLTFAIAYRMRFIDFLLAEYGTVNRSALMSYFGISPPQASHDFATYTQLAPGNMAYDMSAKTYRRTRDFERVWK
jgi:hypothetical protein